MKRLTFAVVLVACFATLTMAADRQPATVGEYAGLSQVRADGVHSHAGTVRCANVSGYYYYSGSLDTTSQYATGLSNEEDLAVTQSQVYQPFSVVAAGKKKHLSVTGLCVNSLDTVNVIDNPTPYEVRFGARPGSCGKLVCSGTATSTDNPTGRSIFGITEYTHAVKVTKCKVKGAANTGTQYHMNVVPVCMSSQCSTSQRFFESTDDSNIGHIGPPTHKDNALWNSTTFGEYWVCPTCVFGGYSMESFSAGVTGRLVK
jgi:hypothetical protein